MSEHGVVHRLHAPYPASSAERLYLCPGSKRMEDAVPPRAESVYAAEGTRGHYLLECLIRCYLGGNDGADVCEATEAARVCKKETIDAVHETVDYVVGILETYPDAQILTEQRLHFPSVYAPDDVWGTTDIVIFIPSLAWLIVIDYKNGVGVVEVEGNRQLLRYGASAVFNCITTGVLHVSLVIAQPNAFHPAGPIRHWNLTFDELLDWTAKLDEEIRVSQDPCAPLVPGEKQCRYCNASTTCPAAEAKALSVVGTNYGSVRDLARVQLPSPQEMPVDRLAYILDAKGMLEDWLGECEKHAHELARQGYYIPGRKLVEAKAMRRWYGEPEQVAQQLLGLIGKGVDYDSLALDFLLLAQDGDFALGEIARRLEEFHRGTTALDDVMPRKLITITDADKLVAKAYKARGKKSDAKKLAEDAAQAMAFLTLKESSGNTSLVPATDPRPAVNLTAAAFANVQLPSATTA